MSSKTILLTGASSGMGKVIAATLAEQGHRVFAGMRNMAGRNAPVAAELSNLAAAHAITPVDIDVTNDESVARCVARVGDAAGHVEILINCAGVMWTGTTEAFATAQFEALLQTNVVGPFRLIKAVLPGMRAQGDGLLITVTSTCGRIIPPNYGIYAASKFALEALAEAIFYETADLGIDSVILEPGPFDTGLMGNQVPPHDQHIVEQYGEMGAFDTRLSIAAREAMKLDPGPYDPRIVANAVADIIAMQKGERPLRLPLGKVGTVPSVNQQIAIAQGVALQRFGLGHLAEKELQHG